jgi:hypothetical protein
MLGALLQGPVRLNWLELCAGSAAYLNAYLNVFTVVTTG